MYFYSMKKYTPDLVRNSHLSNDVFEKSQIRLSLRGKKTLYGLIQSVDPTGELFGEEMTFDIRAFFKMLDIEGDNNRWNIVRDCFVEIAKSPMLDISEDSRHGVIVQWVSKLQWDADKSTVKLRFTEDIKPYLHQMKGYIKLKGKYISNLDSNHAMSLYPLMKVVLGKHRGRKIYTLEELMLATNTHDKKLNKSYHHPVAGKGNFMRKVLGIKRNSKTKQYDILQPYKEKSSGSLITPPLAEINIKTDVNVTCQPVKDGQTVVAFLFVVRESTPLSDKVALVEKIKVGIELHTPQLIKLAETKGFDDVEEYARSEGYLVLDGKAYKVDDQIEMMMTTVDPLDRWKNNPTDRMSEIRLDNWRKKAIIEFMPENIFWELSYLFQSRINNKEFKEQYLPMEAGKHFGVFKIVELEKNKEDGWMSHLNDILNAKKEKSNNHEL